MPDNTWYCRVRPEDVDTVMQEHIENGQPVERLLHPRLHPRADAYAHLAAQYQSLTEET